MWTFKELLCWSSHVRYATCSLNLQISNRVLIIYKQGTLFPHFLGLISKHELRYTNELRQFSKNLLFTIVCTSQLRMECQNYICILGKGSPIHRYMWWPFTIPILDNQNQRRWWWRQSGKYSYHFTVWFCGVITVARCSIPYVQCLYISPQTIMDDRVISTTNHTNS